ncbi:unnamed protein product [Thlaspi arvense]|uniref:DNA-directed RNA polymerase subunit n=1 Tax=Thlaspi arvense TaxID=13288 RepID=A0AAU9SRF1_THLAR|nr:unnamed protein product [Thlaspi arvense]
MSTNDVGTMQIIFTGSMQIESGQILHGVVHKVYTYGVYLRCGPVKNVYISYMKMLDYKFVPGKNPIFMNEKMSRIQEGTTVRFMVITTKWMEAQRELHTLGTLEGEIIFRGSMQIESGQILHGVVHKVYKYGIYLRCGPEGTMVRFMVITTKWMEAQRELHTLGTLEGDFLGPISEGFSGNRSRL